VASMSAYFVAVIIAGLIYIPLNRAAYPFRTTSVTVSAKPTDPFLLQFHHTRYFGGCFEPMRQNYGYNTIVPFIQNFDVAVTGCDMNWNNPIDSRNQGTCAFVFQNRSASEHKVERVHVHADYRHNRHFVDNMLPYYIKRHKDTGVGIILHTGGGDSPPNALIWPTYLNTPAILRWLVEQDRVPELLDNAKVMLLPVGVCVRENVGERGKELRQAIQESTYSSNHTKRALMVEASYETLLSEYVYYTIPGAPGTSLYHRNVRALLATSAQKRTPHASNTPNAELNETSPEIHSVAQAHRLLQQTIASHAKPWENRKDRVYLCFSEGYEGRKRFMAYARAGNCSVCDFCDRNMPSLELWRTYGDYKYVLSPHGNGPDCGRSWEIMLMGAVPIIEYFPGGLGYERANLSALTVKEPTELTVANVTRWSVMFPNGQNRQKLTYDYWRHKMFDEHF